MYKKMLKRKSNNGPVCPACSRRINNQNIPNNRPIDIYENCNFCKKRSKILKFLPFIVTVAVAINWIVEGSVSLETLGFTLSVIGSVLLVSSLDVLVLAGVIYDGYKHVETELPKANRRQWYGIVLLSLGFLMALIGNTEANQITLNMPEVSIGGLSRWLGSLVISGFISLVVVLLYEYLSKPRIIFTGFTSTDFNLSDSLYKLNFTIKGKRDPGFSEVSIEWKDSNSNFQKVFAKWDETPNPLDSKGEFVPEMVPQTFRNLLRSGKSYSIPILSKDGNELSVFSGWWFARDSGYGPADRAVVEKKTKITIKLSGSELNDEYVVFVKEIVKD